MERPQAKTAEQALRVIPSPCKLVDHLDLSWFKTKACHKHSAFHNHKHCIYYHSKKDRRRDISQIPYSPEICDYVARGLDCKDGDNCKYSHNKVEQAYHPDKYRQKFCSYFPASIGSCEYGKFCSYAHSETELKGVLMHYFTQDVDFFIFHFKTQFCPYTAAHDRSLCIYAHNWQDFRRDPLKHQYQAVSCPNWDNTIKIVEYIDGCPNGSDCMSCHGRVSPQTGWKELEFHPLRYKQIECNLSDCSQTRKFCPYLHEGEDPL